MNLQELARQDGPAEAIAAAAVAAMDEREARDSLVTLLTAAIDRVRRDITRAVEDEAARGSAHVFRRELRRIVESNEQRNNKAWKECEAIQARLDAEDVTFEDAIREMYSLRVEGLGIHKTFRVEVDPGEDPSHNVIASVQARVHRPDEHGLFYPEYEIERVQRVVRDRLSALHRRAAAERERRDGRESEGFERVGSWYADLGVIFGRIRHHARIELTRELLDSTFAVGGGRVVSWGDATESDHQARIEAQIKHAAGTLEDAERHRIAIALLRESGAHCLNEVAASEHESAVA